jgi:hypothetical protein
MTKKATDVDVESAFASWSNSIERSLSAANELNEALESVLRELRERTISLRLQVSAASAALEAVSVDDNFHKLSDTSNTHVKEALSVLRLKTGI